MQRIIVVGLVPAVKSGEKGKEGGKVTRDRFRPAPAFLGINHL